MFNSSPRPPVSGMVARVASWEGVVWDAGWYLRLESFLLSLGLKIISKRRPSGFVRPVFTTDRYFLKARHQLDRVTARGYRNYEGWTDGKELRRARSFVASTTWSREDLFFPAQFSSRNQHSSSSIEKYGIMLVLKRVVFLGNFIWHLKYSSHLYFIFIAF